LQGTWSNTPDSQVDYITGITDAVFPGSRTFTCDALNRLTSATGTFGPGQSQITQDYCYDAVGNFVVKAGVWYYYDDINHPSAVTSTTDGKSYTYDANGNRGRTVRAATLI